jgi:hypothetical protein
MRVTVNAYMDKTDDGYDGSSDVSRDGVMDLSDLATVFAQAAVSMGYTYVKAVGFEDDAGDMHWGDV